MTDDEIVAALAEVLLSLRGPRMADETADALLPIVHRIAERRAAEAVRRCEAIATDLERAAPRELVSARFVAIELRAALDESCPLADWERELICRRCGSSCCDRPAHRTATHDDEGTGR